jgi:pimeloyl-ACP methyl ester carboxylesterase
VWFGRLGLLGRENGGHIFIASFHARNIGTTRPETTLHSCNRLRENLTLKDPADLFLKNGGIFMAQHGAKTRHRLKIITLYNLLSLSVIMGATQVFRLIFCRSSGCFESMVAWTDFGSYLFAGLVRPLFLAPATMMIPAGSDVVETSFFYASQAAVGVILPYALGRFLNSRMIDGWLSSNLPDSNRNIRRNWFKIIVLIRLIPILSLDLFSLLFGAVRFPLSGVVVLTFVTEFFGGVLIDSLRAGGMIDKSIGIGLWSLVVGLVLLVLRHELKRHSKRASVVDALISIYSEIRDEMVSRNTPGDLQEPQSSEDSQREMIVLSYGFFSSRKSVRTLKRRLEASGFDVSVPALPGFFGVLNTEGLDRAADALELECLRLKAEGRKFHVVGYSKGGLVAAYMFARSRQPVGSSAFVSIAAPYDGSPLTYLLLFTPFGFFWRDVWDMRPGSEYLAFIKDRLPKAPGGLSVSSIFSPMDRVAGRSARIGFMESRSVETNFTHFDFLVSHKTPSLIKDCLAPKLVTSSPLQPVPEFK